MSSTCDNGDPGPRSAKVHPLIWIAVVSVLVIGAAALGYSVGARSAVVDARGEVVDAADAYAQQRGFALPSWQEGGYDAPNLEQSLREIEHIGATWVQFTPTWYQRDAERK